MKTLITFAGMAGTTEKCAHMLAKKMGNVKVIDLDKEMPDISKYDMVILGSNIHMGRFHKKVRVFMNENGEVLKSKKHAFFICNAFPEQAEAFFIQNISEELLKTAICVASFGGELDLSKLKGFQKFIAKMVTNSTRGDENKAPKILEERIQTFADTVKQV